MANSFYLQILSVNRQFFSGRCEALIFQEEDGERDQSLRHGEGQGQGGEHCAAGEPPQGG